LLPRTAQLEPSELTPILRLPRGELQKKMDRRRLKGEADRAVVVDAAVAAGDLLLWLP